MSSGSQVLPGRSSSNDVAALRARTFAALRSVMSPTEWSAAAGCSRRLQRELGPERAAGSTVLVAFGGGKDSAYTITFVRAMQLLLLNETGSAFRLRVATNRHAGMPCAVMENIDRAYRALGITHDPDVESLLIDGDSIGPFDVAAPLPPDVIQRNRGDILMAGHRTNGDGRPTFCNACNLSVANAFGLAASHDGGVDVIITGDSPAEQRAYRAWIRGLAQRVGAAPSTAGRQRFSDVLADVDAIGAA